MTAGWRRRVAAPQVVGESCALTAPITPGHAQALFLQRMQIEIDHHLSRPAAIGQQL
jgi:hypothetical protein